MENNKKGKIKGQVSVFIILGIALAVVLVLIFINKPDITKIFVRESPVEKIQKCIQTGAKEGIDILNLQGGSLNPKNYYLYDGNKVDYICYTESYYKKCVMQKPLIKQSIEKELKEYLQPKVNACLESVKNSIAQEGYSVSFKKPEISVQIIPNNIIIDTNVELRITKESSEFYKNIKAGIDSDLYDFTMTASSIANWEARYGDSETMSYMLYYPQLKVEKKIRSEGTRIYILTERESGEKFMFAIRSFAIPFGVTGR